MEGSGNPGDKAGGVGGFDPGDRIGNLQRLHLTLEEMNHPGVGSGGVGVTGGVACHVVGWGEHTSDNILYGSFLNPRGVVGFTQVEGGVAGDKEMTGGEGDEGGEETPEVSGDYPRETEGSGGGGHYGGDDAVHFVDFGGGKVEDFGGDAVEGGVVEDDYPVGVLGETFEGEDTVVGLYDDVRLPGFAVVGKHAVGLYKSFRVAL